MAKIRRMGRTEVACAECRRRKLKCEGTRPSCSRCQDLQLECLYAPPHSSGRVTKPGRQRTTVDEGVPVDVLSTQALAEVSNSEVGYFGPTSNYAMFRLISKIFAQATIMHLPADGTGQSLDVCHHCAQHHETSLTTDNDTGTAGGLAHSELYALPPTEEATALLDRYFSTIDLVLPSVEQNPPRFRRVLLALLNILWAPASASLGSSEREAFYERSVALLDPRTIERPSYELVQTLLLMVEYKQNHRRSISSYTTHALCVKAAFHIGLQYGAAAGKPNEKVLRLRLGHGIMGLTQGRPFLIPQSLNVVSNEVPSPKISDLYVARVATSHPIIEHAVEALYNGNLEQAEPPRIQTLISKRADLGWQIDEWSDSLDMVGGLISPSELTTPSEVTDGYVAARVLLSIQYYRIRMLINFPLITQFLLSGEATSLGPHTSNHFRQVLPQIVQDDRDAVRELCGIISALSNFNNGFTSKFAAWYACNYSMLTITLHYFMILLVTKHDPNILDDTSAAEVRQELGEALDVMKTFGKTNLITQKASCCIGRLLTVFDTLEYQLGVAPFMPFDYWDTDYILENIGRPSADFLTTFSCDEVDQLPPSFLGLYSSIPLCE
ncbi:hypothetical protein BDW74DRAFT_165079 [Aspergillus multicolor]|uniref:uncharacterized protein n=1 Tax=Aspergillus multicolor TaxID=41759 RepID=UPI003CCE1F58